MLESNHDRASAQINLLARRESWPLICDSHLRFVTPQLKTALEVWTSKRDGRAMPSRSDMTLRDLRAALPNLAFLSVVRKGANIRLQAKLIGSELDRFLGGPMTGRFVDEALPAPFAEKWLALWLPALEARVPTRTVGRVEFADQRYYVSETLHAPLADDGETPETLMLVAYFHFVSGEGAGSDGIAARLLSEIDHRAATA